LRGRRHAEGAVSSLYRSRVGPLVALTILGCGPLITSKGGLYCFQPVDKPKACFATDEERNRAEGEARRDEAEVAEQRRRAAQATAADEAERAEIARRKRAEEAFQAEAATQAARDQEWKDAQAAKAAERDRAEAARASAAERKAAAGGSNQEQALRCCDGTLSPSCVCGGSHRGCCSHHHGICGCAR
jgi:hypothetical protein